MSCIYKNPKDVRGETVILTDMVVTKETGAAFLIVWGGSEIWLPKSQVISIESNGGTQIAIISDWIADQKGILYDKSTGLANPF
jgi:hypothetical protein